MSHIFHVIKKMIKNAKNSNGTRIITYCNDTRNFDDCNYLKNEDIICKNNQSLNSAKNDREIALNQHTANNCLKIDQFKKFKIPNRKEQSCASFEAF